MHLLLPAWLSTALPDWHEQAQVGITSEVAPFGGVKMSGVGREHGKYGMDEYLSIKVRGMSLLLP